MHYNTEETLYCDLKMIIIFFGGANKTKKFKCYVFIFSFLFFSGSAHFKVNLSHHAATLEVY